MGAGASVDSISSETVSAAVSALGTAYEKYRSTIEENGFNGELLADITDDRELENILESMGITNLLHKKNLIKQFHKWKDSGAVVTPSTPSSSAHQQPPTEVVNASSKSYNIAYQDTITVAPKDILSEIFQIQGIPLDPQDLEPAGQAIYTAVKERCNAVNEGMIYDCFIGYRVASESDVAEKLYLLLKLKGLNPFWDKKCLAKGEDWKSAFMKGLQCSKCYVPLISAKALQPCKDPLKDHSGDNYLLEMELGMKIRQETGLSNFIVPIHIGEYMTVVGEGMIMKKFRDFQCTLYSSSIMVSKPVKASILAKQSAEKAEKCRLHGRKEYSDGYYAGDLVNDQRIGWGVLEITSGTSQGFYYAGEWRKDSQHGYGVSHSTLTVMHGLSFAGEWKEGEWNGYGIRSFPEGITLEGEFKSCEYVGPKLQLDDDCLDKKNKKMLCFSDDNNNNDNKVVDSNNSSNDDGIIAYTKLQNPPNAIFATLFQPFIVSKEDNSNNNSDHHNVMIDWDPEDSDGALYKAKQTLMKAAESTTDEKQQYDCLIIYRKQSVVDVTIATTLTRYLEAKKSTDQNSVTTVYPLDYYKFGPNQRSAQKEALEKALKQVKCAIILVSKEAVKPCQDPVISHMEDEYMMQIEAVLKRNRRSTNNNKASLRVLPIFIGDYVEIEGYGHLLQKFRTFDASLYGETIEINEAKKAAYFAREAVKKAKALKDPKTITYGDGGEYIGEVDAEENKIGLGIYKSSETHTFVDDFLKWYAGAVYEGEFAENFAHGYGVLTYPWLGSYEGEFKDGRKHGYGIRYFAHGVKLEGRWVKDVYQR